MRHVVFPAGPTDAADLARVHVASWRETYRGLLPDAYLARLSEARHAARFARSLIAPPGGEIILAAADRQGLAAYAAGGPSRTKRPQEGEVYTLYVLRRAQGRGVGGALMTHMARALIVAALRDNIPARAFYEHLGGQAQAPRAERGPGGAVLHEVAYRWEDIAALI